MVFVISYFSLYFKTFIVISLKGSSGIIKVYLEFRVIWSKTICPTWWFVSRDS
jgi:hypothetical protein